jgi:hypothetical protein
LKRYASSELPAFRSGLGLQIPRFARDDNNERDNENGRGRQRLGLVSHLLQEVKPGSTGLTFVTGAGLEGAAIINLHPGEGP